jgi:hypothetical protein
MEFSAKPDRHGGKIVFLAYCQFIIQAAVTDNILFL